MRVYLIGKMTGMPDLNRPEFDAAEKRWTEAGHQVFNPHRMSDGFNYPRTTDGTEEHTRRLTMMQLMFPCLSNVEAVAVIPGWEKGRGSTVEVAMAQYLDLPIYDAVSMEKIHVQKRPWDKVDRDSLDKQADKAAAELSEYTSTRGMR